MTRSGSRGGAFVHVGHPQWVEHVVSDRALSRVLWPGPAASRAALCLRFLLS